MSVDLGVTVSVGELRQFMNRSRSHRAIFRTDTDTYTDHLGQTPASNPPFDLHWPMQLINLKRY
jgi:hypothetical protein